MSVVEVVWEFTKALVFMVTVGAFVRWLFELATEPKRGARLTERRGGR